jgi:hypothetical protein
MTSIKPGNASAPTEPVTALHLGKSDRSPKRETIKGLNVRVKPRSHVRLEQPLDQISDPDNGAADNHQQPNHDSSNR